MRYLLTLGVALLSLSLPGCSGGVRDVATLTNRPPPVPAADFFPLVPGTTWIYEGHDQDVTAREEVRVLDAPERIFEVDCTALLQHVFRSGRLVEIATEYLARDRLGNLWKFGEVGFEVTAAGLVPRADSWLAGEDGAEPWILLPAQPIPGEVWNGDTPHQRETFTLLSVTATATVPAGQFVNCLEICEENDDPQDADIILYAPGIGPVANTNATSRLQLTSIRRP